MRKAAALVIAALAILSFSGASATEARVTRAVGNAPAWYTPELQRQIDAAGPKGVPIPKSAGIKASSLTFLGIRPGQLILVDNGGGVTSLCSSNFVFQSNSTTGKGKKRTGTAGATRYYIGTAGHCGKVGDDVTMVFLPLGLVNIGGIVKSADPPVDRDGNFDTSLLDFALIEIDPELNQYVSPSMAYWGGPTGVFTGDGVQPILHAGWGAGVGAGGTPRAAVAYDWNVGSEFRFEGAIAPVDSGSGAIVAGGLAAGNITHIAVDTSQTPPVWNGGSTMTSILKYVGTGISLATCSLPVPWPLPGCPPV